MNAGSSVRDGNDSGGLGDGPSSVREAEPLRSENTVESITKDPIHIRAWAWVGLPILIYLASHLLFMAAAATAEFDWLDPGSRIRWDSIIYLDIAHTGYYAAPCAEINPSVRTPGAFCGNAGWFPLFPYLVLGVAKASGLGLNITAVLVTEACTLGMLIMAWRLLGPAVTPVTVGCLALAAALPGSVYFHAVYPMSLAVLLTLVTLQLLIRGNWAVAGAAGAITATSYPLAVLVAPAAMALLLFLPGKRSWKRLAVAAYVGALTSAGVPAVFGLLHVTTGHFGAYLQIQRNYGHGVHDPVATFLTVLAQSRPAVSAELLFSTVLVLLGVLAVIRPAQRARVTTLDRTMGLVYGPLLLIAPLVVGANQAQFRSHTLLLPLVVVMRHLKAPLVLTLVAAALPLTFMMTMLFVNNSLV